MNIRDGQHGVGWGLAFCAVLALAACGGSSSSTGPAGDGADTNVPGDDGSGSIEPDPGGGTGPGGGSIAWGPRLPMSELSPLMGAEDTFGPGVMAALVRAARAVPNGASQSSWVDADGRTVDQITVHVEYNDDVGGQVHVITDSGQMAILVPGFIPRQGHQIAAFTNLIPGIEPDLSSYPHEVLGVWAWDGGAQEPEGRVGAFWSLSPSVPPVAFGPRTPRGTATYEGDAVGLLAAGETATTFAADVQLDADFDDRTVGGTVDGFRSLDGTQLSALPLTLGTTNFSAEGDPFSGDTMSAAVDGSGKWGARWSDGDGLAMGGTFGFAADGIVAMLGAFTARTGASADGGNPDDPVATGQ